MNDIENTMFCYGECDKMVKPKYIKYETDHPEICGYFECEECGSFIDVDFY